MKLHQFRLTSECGVIWWLIDQNVPAIFIICLSWSFDWNMHEFGYLRLNLCRIWDHVHVFLVWNNASADRPYPRAETTRWKGTRTGRAIDASPTDQCQVLTVAAVSRAQQIDASDGSLPEGMLSYESSGFISPWQPGMLFMHCHHPDRETMPYFVLPSQVGFPYVTIAI
jgi:hypothetical protein